MNFRLIRIIIFSFSLVVSGVIQAQDFFNTQLDTTVFKTDTIFKNRFMVVTYLDVESNNKLVVSFDSKSLKPDGTCIYSGRNGIIVEGAYKSGVLVGEWIEKDKSDSIHKKVNYDYKSLIVSKDSLNFKNKMQSNNKDYLIVAEMPNFKNGDIYEFSRYIKENIFYPASFRFFYKNNKKMKVFVQFEIIDFTKVANVRCVGGNKINDLEYEAKRLIYSTQGLWRNAMHRGKCSDVTLTFPIIFKTE